MRDAGAVTPHRITYEGPASLAIPTATQLADADGIELKSAGRPEPGDGLADTVLLALTVEGSPEAVSSALGAIGAGLPPGARITLDEPR